MKKLLLVLALLTPVILHAQAPEPAPKQDSKYDGIWEGYAGEWDHVTRQILELAQAIPADKYTWRPAPGVRSISEILVHIAQSNFGLLSVTGPVMPADMQSETLEKTLTAKPAILAALQQSFAAVRTAHANLNAAGLAREVNIEGKTVPVDGMYLRILVHDNEHMGQLIAYARFNGIVPPWSLPKK